MQIIVDAVYNQTFQELNVLTNAKNWEDLEEHSSELKFTNRANFYGVWSLFSLTNKVIRYNIEFEEYEKA